MTLILVRHAEPDVRPDQDPREWVLSTAGRRAASALAARLPTDATWVSSTERKAWETLRCATAEQVEVVHDPGFDEVLRDEPFDDGFRARRLAWVTGLLDSRHAGWETPAETAARFDLAVGRHAESDRPLVVASHGMAMTAWLLHQGHLGDAGAAGEFWTRLAFPDVVRVG
jgi:broad specificity phosphatase PhoE